MGHVGAKLSAAVGPETPVPADGRLSRSTANWELPPWVDDGFERDEMAARCESVQAWPFLRTGVAPREGQRLYMNIHYAHDGSHPYTYLYRGLWEGRAVAVKVVECRQDSREAREALNEAVLTEGLDCPHLVKTLRHALQCDSLDQECTFWLVQQLCTHGTLIQAAEAGLLREERSLVAAPDMGAVLRTLREVAAGMAFLHGCGILHRDLTGHNVLLDEAEPSTSDRRGFTCRLADFGMARLAQLQSISTGSFGTVTHMSPELLVDGKLSPAADVWSFGILCWEAYSGIRAFAGLPLPNIIYRVTSGSGRLELPSDAPAGFKALVEACLNTDRHQRPDFPSVLSTLDCLLAQEEG
ncbi:hypothetical protein CHLNCDRAFT_144818 [Chlorella variabilis]|uniref:Protein kinase domain-containing protein n=1 Tax=Chlorella variabilis TaxID=554065 RepID=E1ZD27_CHLVA|nr:hypothetical protein CHLNCDRAFT_144818 [Chlorella variabilis]EFN56147.1 hypothetical protein CHLNCDRAFT_144818 [Chlorella variabilis]|eukprot:XP_005848249.1 hypothetical protein CHLNCDRAFT_144818 [Chlorella variabilis]